MLPSTPRSEGPLEVPEDLYPPVRLRHLRDYVVVVLRRRWLIAAVTITALSVATVKAYLRRAEYTATAIVQVNRHQPDVVQGVTYDPWLDYEEFYPTQLMVLTNFTLANRVVDDLRLWHHPLFRDAEGPEEPTPERREILAGAVVSMLDVSQIQKSQLLKLSATTPDPELSANLANSLVKQYIAFSTESQTDFAQETVSFLGEQIEKMHLEVQETEKLLQEYSQREDIIMVDKKESIVIDQLRDLSRRLSEVRAERTAAEAWEKSLQQADAEALKEVLNKPGLQSLNQHRAALMNRYAEAASEFGSDWPEVKRIREALEDVERRLEAEVTNAVAASHVEYLSLVERERLLAEALEEKKQEAQELNKLAADYNRIRMDLDNKQAMLQHLLRRHSETNMNAEFGKGQSVNVRLVEKARIPRGASTPEVSRSALWAGMFGLTLALGLVFFLDYWDTTIYTFEDIRRRFLLPNLGMVPRLVLKALPADEKGLLGPDPFFASLLQDPRPPSAKTWRFTRYSLALTRRVLPAESIRAGSELAERFKFIRGSLLMATPGKPPRVILVTGPDQAAGKTFVACNLAASLAELNKRVLLVDADLRNPQIHRVFRLQNRVGLSNVLTGQVDAVDGCILGTSIPNLFVLPTGASTPSPSELLGSEQMEHTLERYAKHFDFVLLDSAPLLPVFDSHVLTSRCDASLLVVRSGKTSTNAVKTSLELVERVGGKMSGVVLNHVDLRDYAQSYYNKYYTAYNYSPRAGGRPELNRGDEATGVI